MRAAMKGELLALLFLVSAGWIGACSGQVRSVLALDAGSTSEDAGNDCGFPIVHNEGGCPAAYDTATLPPTCAPVGLSCAYPGAGDGTGCTAATAALWCAAGSDGGANHWIAAQ